MFTEKESLESELYWVEEIVALGFALLNRWKKHRSIVKKLFTSNEFKKYFCARFPAGNVVNYVPTTGHNTTIRLTAIHLTKMNEIK